MKDKFSEDEKKTIEDIVNDGLQFLEGNTEADAEQMGAKQRELEAKFNPIMQKVYQQGAPAGAEGANSNMRGNAEQESSHQ